MSTRRAKPKIPEPKDFEKLTLQKLWSGIDVDQIKDNFINAPETFFYTCTLYDFYKDTNYKYPSILKPLLAAKIGVLDETGTNTKEPDFHQFCFRIGNNKSLNGKLEDGTFCKDELESVNDCALCWQLFLL